MTPCIVYSAAHTRLADLLSDTEAYQVASRTGFLLELRCDRYVDCTSERLQQAFQRFGPENLLVTFRSPSEGGSAEVSDHERVELLAQADRSGVAFLDLELRTVQRLGSDLRTLFPHRRAQLILSSHTYHGVPPRAALQQRRQEAESLGADLVKLAVTPSSLHDTLPLAELLHEQTAKPLLCVAMGEAGFWTRVLGPLFPAAAPMSFARSVQGPETAPGQPNWQELEQLYRFHVLRPGWPVYGVLGFPLTHSLSPQLHNLALREAGCEGVYLPFSLDRDPIRFVQDFAGLLNLQGLSVTLPHKETCLPCCDVLDSVAQSMGAVNTLVRTGQAPPRWCGSNTDAGAGVTALEEAIAGGLSKREIWILGAGGVARALAVGLRNRGARVTLVNRTPERAEHLARELGVAHCPYSAVSHTASCEVLINATPVGMTPYCNELPLPPEALPTGCVVFDTVYNPAETRLLREAALRGHRTVGGEAMFVAQAAEQFQRFTGVPLPIRAIQAFKNRNMSS